MLVSTKPSLNPTMPPVSAVTPTVSELRLSIKFRMLLVSRVWIFSAGSTLSMLTKLLLSQATIAPRLWPAMPPVAFMPETAAVLRQPERMPVASLQPAMPPVSVVPLTVPENEQFSTKPRLRPTRPPVIFLSPPGATLPTTFRFFTVAFWPSSRKKPQGAMASVRDTS